MKVCVAKPDSDLLVFDATPDTSIEELKGLIFSVTSVPLHSQTLMFQGARVNDANTLAGCGVEDGDVLEVLFRVLSPEVQQLVDRHGLAPEKIEQMAASNDGFRTALETNNVQVLDRILQEMRSLKRLRSLGPSSPSLQRMLSDPIDIEAQKKIELEIQSKNIEENYLYANEFTPEVFASVSMLYIDCTVHKVPLQAFVDSGAQNTILSQECAERVGLKRLIDTRFHGVAVGVGSGRIVGRIHAANLEIGGRFFNCSFTVLEKMDIDMLFGLDMLKRHQCCIDLHKGCLSLNAGEVVVPFLSERSIQRKAPTSPTNDEENIAKLTRLGYSQEAAIQALERAKGDVSLAEGYLYSSSP